MKKILITGASGFIGSFIVEEALKRGFETWAAVRKSSSRKYLNDSRIHFIELDLGNLDKLEKQLGLATIGMMPVQSYDLSREHKNGKEGK